MLYSKEFYPQRILSSKYPIFYHQSILYSKEFCHERVVSSKYPVSYHQRVLQPVPWKMRLEMVIGMQNEILIGIMKLLF